MQLMPLSVKVGFAQNFEFESYDNLILKNTSGVDEYCRYRFIRGTYQLRSLFCLFSFDRTKKS